MSALLEQLHEEANSLSPEELGWSVPLHVLTGEATDVAAFFKRTYKPERHPETKAILRPGLNSVGSTRLSPQVGKRILLLVDEVQAAQQAYQLAAEVPEGDAQIVRARFVVSELTAALEFLFDDDVEDERDAQLQQVRRDNDDTNTTDALASALSDYAALAEVYRDELDGFGDFDVAMIDEANSLAKALRERPANKGKTATSKQAAALDWRNRLGTLLAFEVSRVRKTARFVFRHHPKLRREASSAYERRARNARRRAASKNEGKNEGKNENEGPPEGED